MTGLTKGEKVVLRHLTDAYNAMAALRVEHPSDLAKFITAIHTAQAIVATRVARRADPDVWYSEVP